MSPDDPPGRRPIRLRWRFHKSANTRTRSQNRWNRRQRIHCPETAEADADRLSGLARAGNVDFPLDQVTLAIGTQRGVAQNRDDSASGSIHAPMNVPATGRGAHRRSYHPKTFERLERSLGTESKSKYRFETILPPLATPGVAAMKEKSFAFRNVFAPSGYRPRV